MRSVVQRAATAAGFELCGIASVDAPLPELEHFSQWIEAGYAGEMEYLKARAENGELKRSSLRLAAPWAKSVIVCAINYNSEPPYTDTSDRKRGWIARYAWSQEDYHTAVLRRLRQVEERLRQEAGDGSIQTRCYVDTGPLVERVFAKYAGVGWIGKNTCIINESQRLGSWLFLGVILTSVELKADVPAADRCGSCARCIEACPTQALIAPYQLDASKCISYLTIEKRGEIPEHLRAGIGQHVFGCDICQDVCPWNDREHGRAPAAPTPEFQLRQELVNPKLHWLAQMSAEEFSKTFRGSPVKRAKRSGLRRNAVVAMGNSGDADFLPALRRLAHDEDPVVAEHARWAAREIEERVTPLQAGQKAAC